AVFVLEPELRSRRIHGRTVHRITSRNTVAKGTVFFVDLSPAFEGIFAGRKRSLFDFAVNANRLRHMNDLSFVGESRIAYGHRGMAVTKVYVATCEDGDKCRYDAKKKQPQTVNRRIASRHE